MQELLIQLITGAIGGNAAGMAMKDKSLGTIGNTIAGLLGGAGGGKLLELINPQLVEGLVGQVAGSGVGGAVLMIIVALIKNKLMAK